MFLIFATLGIVILVLPQRLFWLSTGALAWVWSMHFLGHPLEDLGGGAILLVALIIAIMAGVLGRARHIASLALAGFLAGSLAVSALLELVGGDFGVLYWPTVAAAAALGVLSSLRWPVRGLMLLFSICGAAILPLSFELQKQSRPVGLILFFVLVAVGVLAQMRVLKAPDPPTAVGAA